MITPIHPVYPSKSFDKHHYFGDKFNPQYNNAQGISSREKPKSTTSSPTTCAHSQTLPTKAILRLDVRFGSVPSSMGKSIAQCGAS